jgi:ketosteroid isomerase-like protein
MSQENVEIVRRIYESINAGDWDAAFRDVDEDVEVETQLTGSFRGRSEVRRFYEDGAAAFEFFSVEPDEVLDVGDQVVALLRLRGRPSGSTAEIKVRVGHLWTIRAGAAVSLRTFPKRDEALEAARLSE